MAGMMPLSTRFLSLLILCASAAIIAACSAAPADEPESLPTETAAPPAMPTASETPVAAASTSDAPLIPTVLPPGGGSANGGEAPAAFLDAVLADASARSGVPQDQLVIREARAVTWSDGSLGCPEPDQAYIQILIDGYQVIVEAGDTIYDYRLDGQGNFKLCGSGLSPGGAGGHVPASAEPLDPGGVLPVETPPDK